MKKELDCEPGSWNMELLTDWNPVEAGGPRWGCWGTASAEGKLAKAPKLVWNCCCWEGRGGRVVGGGAGRLVVGGAVGGAVGGWVGGGAGLRVVARSVTISFSRGKEGKFLKAVKGSLRPAWDCWGFLSRDG